MVERVTKVVGRVTRERESGAIKRVLKIRLKKVGERGTREKESGAIRHSGVIEIKLIKVRPLGCCSFLTLSILHVNSNPQFDKEDLHMLFNYAHDLRVDLPRDKLKVGLKV